MSYKHPALPHRFRLLLPALGPLSRHLLKTLRKSVSHLNNRFRPSAQLLEPTMPSADFSKLFLSSYDDSSSSASFETSPGNAHLHSRLCLPHLRPCIPCRYRALEKLASLPHMTASYVIPVRQASALPAASFRFPLAMDTLAVKLIVPPTGSIGDFHSLEGVPCRAHQQKARWLL